MPHQRNHPHHHAHAEHESGEGASIAPPPIIYSRDPWDVRRFTPLGPRRASRPLSRVTMWAVGLLIVLILGWGVLSVALALFGH